MLTANYSDQDVEQWLATVDQSGVDVLLSTEWPAGILKNIKYLILTAKKILQISLILPLPYSQNSPTDFPKLPSEAESAEPNFAANFIALASVGCEVTANVAKQLCPRYHFAGSKVGGGTFYERPPYKNSLSDYVTRFFSLAPLNNMHKQKVMFGKKVCGGTKSNL